MAQQEGPFSEYLQQAKLAPPMEVPKPTGLEGTGAAIGNIAMNFINGLRQGRMQKQAMQHLEEQKKYDAYQHAIQTVAASDLPDEQKRLLHAQLSTPLIQRIAGDKEATSKHTGNPLTDVLKHMAIGLVGGPGPKKMDLPMEPVVEALRMASDPSLSKTRLASDLGSKALARVAQLNKDYVAQGKRLTYDKIEEDPEYLGYLQQAGRLGIELPAAKAIAAKHPMLGATELEAQRKSEKQAKARAEYEALGRQQAGPQPAVPATAPSQATAPVPQAVPIVTQQPPVEQTAAPATAAVPGEKPSETRRKVTQEQLNQAFLLAQQAGEGREKLEQRGTPSQFIDTKTGQMFTGFNIAGVHGAGVWNPSTGEIHDRDVRLATATDKSKPSAEKLKEVHQTTMDALKASVDPETFKAFSGVLNSQLAEGELSKMDDTLKSAIAASTAKAQLAAHMAQAKQIAADRSDTRSQAALSRLDTAIQRSQKVKDWNIVSDYSAAAESNIANAAKDGNYSVADRLLLRAIAKLTDLSTGVREKEYETFAAAAGRVAAISTEFANLLKGKGEVLDKATRDRFIQTLKDLKARAALGYNAEIKRYKSMGSSFGIPRDLLDISLPEEAVVPGTHQPPGSKSSNSPSFDPNAKIPGKTEQKTTKRSAPSL